MESLEKPKDKGRTKQEHLMTFQSLDTRAIANSKHNLTPSQTHIKPHTEGVYISVSTTYLILHVYLSTKKYKVCWKAKTKSKETKHASETDSDMAESLDWESKIIMLWTELCLPTIHMLKS